MTNDVSIDIGSAILDKYAAIIKQFYDVEQRFATIKDYNDQKRTEAYMQLIQDPNNPKALLKLSAVVWKEKKLVAASVTGIENAYNTFNELRKLVIDAGENQMLADTVKRIDKVLQVITIYQRISITAAQRIHKEQEFLDNPNPEAVGMLLGIWEQEERIVKDTLATTYDEIMTIQTADQFDPIKFPIPKFKEVLARFWSDSQAGRESTVVAGLLAGIQPLNFLGVTYLSNYTRAREFAIAGIVIAVTYFSGYIVALIKKRSSLFREKLDPAHNILRSPEVRKILNERKTLDLQAFKQRKALAS